MLPPKGKQRSWAIRFYAYGKRRYVTLGRSEEGWNLAGHRLSQITIKQVDRYRQEKVREGRLSPTSINKTITRLGQILEVAVEREMIPRNPAIGRRQAPEAEDAPPDAPHRAWTRIRLTNPLTAMSLPLAPRAPGWPSFGA